VEVYVGGQNIMKLTH